LALNTKLFIIAPPEVSELRNNKSEVPALMKNRLSQFSKFEDRAPPKWVITKCNI
jgi:hypothetical protein